MWRCGNTDHEVKERLKIAMQVWLLVVMLNHLTLTGSYMGTLTYERLWGRNEDK